MHVITRYTAWFYLVLLNLINASSTLLKNKPFPSPTPLVRMACNAVARLLVDLSTVFFRNDYRDVIFYGKKRWHGLYVV